MKFSWFVTVVFVLFIVLLCLNIAETGCGYDSDIPIGSKVFIVNGPKIYGTVIKKECTFNKNSNNKAYISLFIVETAYGEITLLSSDFNVIVQ